MITDADGLLRFLNNCLPETGEEADQSTCGACPYMEQCQDYAQVSVPVQWIEDMRSYLKAQIPQPARLLTLEEAQTLTGHGWEEIWFRAYDETPEEKLLFPCVFIHGYLRHEDGDSDDIDPEEYNQPYHSRLWMGDLPRYGWDANPWVWVYEFERVKGEKE